MGWLFHCNTGTLRNELPLSCSISPSDNYVIVKACSKNKMGRATILYSDKINIEVPIGLSFQGLPLFIYKEKLYYNILKFALVYLAKNWKILGIT